MMGPNRMNHPGLGPNHPTNQDDEVFQTLDFFLGAIVFQFSSWPQPGHHPGQHELASWYHPGRLSWLPPWRPSSYQNVAILSSWPRAGAARRVASSWHHPAQLPCGVASSCIILASSWNKLCQCWSFGSSASASCAWFRGLLAVQRYLTPTKEKPGWLASLAL